MECKLVAIAVLIMNSFSITVKMQMDLIIHPDDQFHKLNNIFSNGNDQTVSKDASGDPNLNVTIVFGEDSVNLP